MGRRIQQNPRDRIESPDQWRSVARPVDWAGRTAAVLARDPCCQLCGSTDQPEVDHIGDPSNHDLENLRRLCGPCHRRRTASQGGTAAAAKRIPRQRPPERHPGLKW